MRTHDHSVRVILAEDSVLVREGIRGLLERFGHTVTAAVGDAAALLAAVAADPPDVVITDVRMPPAFADEGLRAALSIRAEHPGVGVLVLSQYVEQTYAAELLDSGDGTGVGYLLKDRVGDVAQFAETVGRVAAGGTAVDSEVVRQLLTHRRAPLTRLTTREREVLALIAEGLSNAGVAESLVVSEAAVGKHITNIFQKLDLGQVPAGHPRVLAVLAYLRGQ